MNIVQHDFSAFRFPYAVAHYCKLHGVYDATTYAMRLAKRSTTRECAEAWVRFLPGMLRARRIEEENNEHKW